jgi:cell division septal protein FtsQ
MAPPAASATARPRGGGRPIQPAAQPRTSLLGALGGAIGWLLWWLVWFPLRSLGRGIRACVLGAVHRPGRAGLIAAAILFVLASAYWLWFRNSSWVAIEEIRVEGHTTQIDEINMALAAAAADMTTLNVSEDALEDALARFQTIRGLSVDVDLPHRVIITIDEQPPIAMVEWSNRLVAVAGDGRILDGISASQLDVPMIEVTEAPSARGLEGEPLQQALVLGAAPVELRPVVEKVAFESGGVVLGIQNGVELRFGPADDLDAKWAAVSAVLADPKLETLSYVDVRIPARPVAGGDPSLTPAEVAATATAPADATTDDATTDPATSVASPADPATDPATTTDPAATATDPTASVPADPETVPGTVDSGGVTP